MKPLLLLAAIVCSLVCNGPAHAERPSTRMTQANVNDQPLAFTIKVEPVNDKKKGELVRFHFAVTAKEGAAPLAPRRATVLEVVDGEEVVSSCSLEPNEQDGVVTYSFLVAEKYAEKSTFLFGEVLSPPSGEPSGRYYWFYLHDFVASE